MAGHLIFYREKTISKIKNKKIKLLTDTHLEFTDMPYIR